MRKIDGGFSGFEYAFVDYGIKGYFGQDNVKVAAVIKLSVETVQNCHSAAKMVIIQSYNTSGFALQKLILFIFNMKNRLDDEQNIVLSRWIFTEAQTVKTR